MNDYGYVSFKVEKEEWNEYLLEDKTLMRIKTIPLKVIKVSGNELTLNETTIIVSFSPPNLKGGASLTIGKPAISDLLKSVKKFDLKFETKKEDWNEYTTDTKIKIYVKSILVSISRTDKYDAFGEPIYLIQTQTLHKFTPVDLIKGGESEIK
ncbi:MAG: hypothetical protein ACYDHX_07720 [Methanothrix sp.]